MYQLQNQPQHPQLQPYQQSLLPNQLKHTPEHRLQPDQQSLLPQQLQHQPQHQLLNQDMDLAAVVNIQEAEVTLEANQIQEATQMKSTRAIWRVFSNYFFWKCWNNKTILHFEKLQKSVSPQMVFKFFRLSSQRHRTCWM